MRAVVYDAFRGPVRVEEVAEPAVPPHGAVIRVEATGLCRSDWHGWMGHDPDIVAFPHVPGHELAGVVEAVGRDVGGWSAGDRVTVPFVCACGTCARCARGDHQVCDRQRQPGFTHWGSFARFVAVDWADVNLVRLPDGLPFTTAAGLGCRFATAYRAVVHVGGARPGEWVAVHGCGGVGLSAVMIAAAAGARVVAVDVDARALALALEVGAESAIDVSGGEGAGSVRAVRELTSGGADLSLDALGAEATAVASIACLAKRGRHVQVGLLPDPPRLPMDLVIGRELAILGSHGMAAGDYGPMLRLVAEQRLRPDRLVTREIGLDDAPAALVAMGEAGSAGATVVRLG